MKFSSDDFNHYNQQFKKIFADVCHLNGWGLNQTNIHAAMAGDLSLANDAWLVMDGGDFFANYYIFFDSQGKSSFNIDGRPNPSLYIHGLKANLYKLWEYADKHLDKKGQILLNKFMIDRCYPHHLAEALKKMNEEKTWSFLKTIKPLFKNSGSKRELDEFFSLIKDKKLDSPEKIDAVYSFVRYCKSSIQKADRMPLMCDYLSKNLALECHLPFEQLLGRKMVRENRAVDAQDIMDILVAQTCLLKKNDYFEKIKFPLIPSLSINNINSFNEKIIKVLNEPDQLKRLGIQAIYYVEFTPSSKFAKVIFEFSAQQNSNNLPQIFLEIANNCAAQYAGYQSSVKDIVKASISHHLLSQKLEEKTGGSAKIKI